MMAVTGIQKPPPAASPAAWPVSSAARLAWLHLRSRRAPAALVALLACGAALWASLRYHWWLGTGNAADDVPMILQGCAAGIIAVTMHSPFGEPERATGRCLPVLRAGLVLVLCGAAIGFFALGAAAAYNPRAGVYLAGGSLPVVRNVLGMTGIGLICCLVTGADRMDRPARLHGHRPVRADRELLRAADLAGPAAGRPGRLDRRHGRLRRRPDRVHHQGFPRPPVG
jgi:hypothetical protein